MRNLTKQRTRLLVVLLLCLLLLKLNLDWVSGAAREGTNTSRISHTLTGDIRLHKNFHSQFLPTDRDVIVYLPPGYDKETTRHYPVLYMQDGQNLFDAATCFLPGTERHFDERAQALVAEQAMQPIIIVGIYSTELNRINEYTPTKPRGINRGGDADQYGRMLVEEIKPFIDCTYRTLPSRSNTGLGGSSLGGLVTVYLGLKYANVFSKLAVTSPAAYWDDEMIIRYVRSMPRNNHQRLFLSVGAGESDLFVTSTRALHSALAANGWKDGGNLAYFEAPISEHKPGAWTPGVSLQLQFLFPSQPSNQSH